MTNRKTSGLSIKNYCRRVEKSEHQYRYWYRRLREIRALVMVQPASTEGFIELTPFSPCREANNGIDIRIGTATIALTATTDEALFRRALAAVAAVLGEAGR